MRQRRRSGGVAAVTRWEPTYPSVRQGIPAVVAALDRAVMERAA